MNGVRATAVTALVVFAVLLLQASVTAQLGRDGPNSPGSWARDRPPNDLAALAGGTPLVAPDLHLNWSHWNQSGAPPVRIDGAVTFDAADGYVLLFGGYGRSGVLGDTWEFHNRSWTEVCSGSSAAPSCATEPGADQFPAMGYDGADHYVVLVNSSGATWSYSNGTWTPRAAGQTFVRPGALAYDPSLGKLVLYRGSAGPYGLTYTYAGGNWTVVSSTLEPSSRDGAAFFYDPYERGLVLFGGQTGGAPPTNPDDMWTFDGTNWTKSTPAVLPPAGSFDGFGYDTAFGYGLLTVRTSTSVDTWAFLNGTWINQTSDLPTEPGAADLWQQTYDAADGYTLLLGANGLSTINDTWALWGPLSGMIRASPSILDLGQPTNLTFAVWGGLRPYADSFTSEPAGCLIANLSSNGSQVGCIPTAAGPWQFGLRVHAAAGGNLNLTAAVQVNPDPSATVSALPNPTTVGVAVVDTASIQGGTAPFATTWAFGDGTGSAGVTAVHAYVTPGRYVVVFHAVDARNVSASANVSLQVNPLPSALIELNRTVTDVGLPVSMTSTTQGGTAPLQTTWQFGDGNGSGSANTTHSYTVAGRYLVRLNTTDSLGVASSSSAAVVVNPDPVLRASSNDSVPVVGDEVLLTSVSVGGTAPYSFLWTFDGATIGTTANVTTRFDQVGNFTASVLLTDLAGYRATESIQISVHPAAQPPAETAGNATTSIPVAEIAGIAAVVGAVVFIAGVFVGLRRRRPPNLPENRTASD
jgi:hypothetical protein